MHPEDIKASIRKQGTTLTDLSLDWGFSESAVRAALRRPSPRIDPLIADFIGKALHEVFPNRYDKRNIRIYPNKIKSKAKKQQSHCKKSLPKFTQGELSHAQV